jgi:hypothetical protein
LRRPPLVPFPLSARPQHCSCRLSSHTNSAHCLPHPPTAPAPWLASRLPISQPSPRSHPPTCSVVGLAVETRRDTGGADSLTDGVSRPRLPGGERVEGAGFGLTVLRCLGKGGRTHRAWETPPCRWVVLCASGAAHGLSYGSETKQGQSAPLRPVRRRRGARGTQPLARTTPEAACLASICAAP